MEYECVSPNISENVMHQAFILNGVNYTGFFPSDFSFSHAIACKNSNSFPILSMNDKCLVAGCVFNGTQGRVIYFGHDAFIKDNTLIPGLLENCLKWVSKEMKYAKYTNYKADVSLLASYGYVNNILAVEDIFEPLNESWMSSDFIVLNMTYSPDKNSMTAVKRIEEYLNKGGGMIIVSNSAGIDFLRYDNRSIFEDQGLFFLHDYVEDYSQGYLIPQIEEEFKQKCSTSTQCKLDNNEEFEQLKQQATAMLLEQDEETIALDQIRMELLIDVDGVFVNDYLSKTFCFGRNTCPIIISSQQSHVCGGGAAVINNNGRVISLDIAFGSSEVNCQLMFNCINWVSKGKMQASYMLKGTVDEALFSGCTCVPGDPLEEEANLEGVEFIVLATNDMSMEMEYGSKTHMKIREYLMNGGGLIMLSKAWVIEPYSNYHTLSKYPGSVLLHEFGLILTDEISWEGTYYLNNNEMNAVYNISLELLKLLRKIVNENLLSEEALFYEHVFKIWSALNSIECLLGNLNGDCISNVEKYSIYLNPIRLIYNLAITYQKVNVVIPPFTSFYQRACVLLVMCGNYFHLFKRDSDNPQIRSGMIFPGLSEVNLSNTQRTVATVDISTDRSLLNFTGYYIIPGGRLNVKINWENGPINISLQIGCHSDSLVELDKWQRYPQICKMVKTTSRDISLIAYSGGMIYIKIDENMQTPVRLSMTLDGDIVEAPFFKYGVHTAADWEKIKMYPAPWAELECEHYIITMLKSYLVMYPHNIEDLAKYWGTTMMSKYYDLGGEDIRKYKERIVTDIDISAGYLHSGYPMMSHLDMNNYFIHPSYPAHLEEYLDFHKWGIHHELGHNFQKDPWTWDGMVEVSCNFFSLFLELNFPTSKYFMEERAEIGKEMTTKKEQYLKEPNYDKCKEDAFLFLAFFQELIMAFGFESFKRLFREYRLPGAELPKNNQEKIDQFCVRYSTLVNRNIGPLMQKWMIPISEEALQLSSIYRSWSDDRVICDFNERFCKQAPGFSITCNNSHYGQKNTFSVSICTWTHMCVKQQHRFVIKFLYDAPFHPMSKTKDADFTLNLEGDSANYLKNSGVFTSDENGTCIIEISIIKFIPIETELFFSFDLINSTSRQEGSIGATIKIMDSNNQLRHWYELQLEKKIQLID